MASYIQTLDLTQRSQDKKRRENDDRLQEPDPSLPEVSADDLPDMVQQAFRAAGWTELTPVQKKAVPYILEGHDLMVQARTGTGKTGAFLLPLFEVLKPKERTQQVLILAPTRELARQINEEFERMKLATAETNELDSVLIYGGVSYKPQIKSLKEGAQVVIGTPGRIMDHLDSGNFTLDDVSLFILDEADEMLSMGFYPDMKKLQEYLPKKRRSYMFSATMPPKVRSLADEFLDDPGFLSLSVGDESLDAIDYQYCLVNKMEKDRALVRLIAAENPESAVVFCNTKRDVGYLAQFLSNYGHDADEISGDLSQNAREKALDRIREGKLRFLVATDVAARGLDISDLSHVFIYDIPQDPEYFIHRTGRTARAGNTGTAIALATHEDKFKLERTAKRYGVEITERSMPSDQEISDALFDRVIVALEEQMRGLNNMQRERLKFFIPLVERITEERPRLLAMLMDELYRDFLKKRKKLQDEELSNSENN